MQNDILTINKLGHLCIGGVDSTHLTSQFETPLYVLDENKIISNCVKIKNALNRFYNGNGLILYASKAFCCKEMYRILESQNIGADVVSGGELYTALAAGFKPENIYFHGNNKTTDELVLAVQSGVGALVVDNLEEMERLSAIAVSAQKEIKILLRIKPGVEAHTHQFIKTGQIDSKFGFAIETGEALAAFETARKLKGLKLEGLHCHIGSQIFDIAPFECAALVMLNFALNLKNNYNFIIKELNLGGGFGIQYLPQDIMTEPERFIQCVANTVKTFCKKNNFQLPKICVEPGRSIIGDAGITLYTVGSIKNIPNVRTYVAVDGGMTDNPRYILYGAKYEMLLANKADKPKDTCVTIAGRCCESGDLLGENIILQKAVPGDILAVLSTGAYNYSMASNYNRVPRPAVVLVNNGKSSVIVRRETYLDLIRNDL